MNNILNQILGTSDLSKFMVDVFFSLAGALLSLLLHANRRKVSSARSPINFSYAFLICDNAKRILTSLLLIFVALRFSDQLLGSPSSPFVAFGIGFGIDRLNQVFKKKFNSK